MKLGYRVLRLLLRWDPDAASHVPVRLVEHRCVEHIDMLSEQGEKNGCQIEITQQGMTRQLT